MIEKTIKLYEYKELPSDIQTIAHDEWLHKGIDTYDVLVFLDNYLDELLEEKNLKPILTADKKYKATHAQIFFSLAHCQGDGVVFVGTFKWTVNKKVYIVNVKHDGMYTHFYSSTIEIEDSEGNILDEQSYHHKKFQRIYQELCKELEKVGYSYIDDITSQEYFEEVCSNHEYLFTSDGKQYIE